MECRNKRKRMSRKKKKYQCILTIYSTDDSKAEIIYNELKNLFFEKYSHRVILNKLYKMTDVKRKREEREIESKKRKERITLIQENAIKKEVKKKKPRKKNKKNKKPVIDNPKVEEKPYTKFINQD